MITEEQYIQAANLLGCSVAAIKAVKDVEAQGEGFLPSGKLKILFEGHKFYKYVPNAAEVAKKEPTLCHLKYSNKHYLGGEKEYQRFNKAFAINARAAMLSTSWGMFQTMGFNHQDAGYNSVNEMIDDYKKGEYQQLISFCNFLLKVDLHKCLQGATPNFAAFALGYNGKAYKINQYDVKMLKAFQKYEK